MAPPLVAVLGRLGVGFDLHAVCLGGLSHGCSLRFQWTRRRPGAATGKPIEAAFAPVYTVQADDVGARISSCLQRPMFF